MKMKKLDLPLKDQDINDLHAGDWLEITGTIYTARDQAHKRLIEAINSGQKLPFPEPNPVLYYAGPTPAKPDEVIGSAGPTTSSRMDPFTPTLIDQGLKITIGKGDRSEQVISAIRKHKGLYLIAFGGCGALYQSCIKKAELIAYPDLLSEAIYKLEIVDFPTVVAIDSQGESIF